MQPWASQGFQAEKPVSFCTAELLILVFPTSRETGLGMFVNSFQRRTRHFIFSAFIRVLGGGTC